MAMVDSSAEVPLQPSVEELIKKICSEKCIQPPNVSARRLLLTITEESAIKILNKIAGSSSIRTFSGFVVYMVRKNSASVSSPNNVSLTPQKRSPPPSFAAGSPLKYACNSSPNPNHNQFVSSPVSGSKTRTIPDYFPGSPNDGYGSIISKQITAASCLGGLIDANSNSASPNLNLNQFVSSPVSGSETRTIPDHFPGSPNDGYGSIISKQITAASCLGGLIDANANSASWHLAESSKAAPRVQKQLIFSLDSSLNKSSQHLYNSSNVSHHFSAVEKQHTLSPCSSSKGTSLRRFSDFSSATHKGSLIPEQHSLSPCASLGGATHSSIEPGFGSMTQNCSDRRNSLAISQQSLLLAELEFRKLFLVYSYVGRNKLEDVVSVADAVELNSMKRITMYDFESKIWAKYGSQFCERADRALHFDWDSGKTYLYHCYVSADGNYQFKGPFLNTRRTHLQRELGDDNVLIVQFTDESNSPDMPSNYCNWIAAYQRVSGGISIGLRHYRLFAFKDSKGDNKNMKVHNMKKLRSTWAVKCYFVRKESHAPWAEKDDCILLKKTSHEARCLFMHLHMVSSMAKYISRCSLALSNTVKLRVDLASVTVERIEDIPCRDENGYVVCNEDGEPLIHTDGTGFISEDLAILCAKDFIDAKGAKDDSYELVDLLKLEEELQGIEGKEACIGEPPLLIQCRLFKEGYAVKGTLLVNKKLKARTIQIRPSMIKVEKDTKLSDSTSFSSLEIVSISRRPRKSNLSKNLIALLTVGGVPKAFFLKLLDNTLQDAQKVSSSMRAAVRVGLNYGQMDDSATSVAMIGSGIPLDEPYLQYRLSILANEERKGLRGGKIPIDESFYLIGTADPTGTLNSDEVCIILENGQISGKVLVYRNPGLHFGDIHILNAKYVEKMEEFVGNAKYGIFFSTKGRRSVGSEIANGDFDGDLYWVSKNSQLLHYFKVSEPWQRIHSTPSLPSKRPSELSYDELEIELLTRLFATQKQNIVAGKAADSWLTFMDQYLVLREDDADGKHQIKEKLLKLVDLYYDALDAPKTGKTVDIPRHLLPQEYPHYLEKKIGKTYHSTSVLGEIYDIAKWYQPDNALIKEIWKLPSFEVEIPEATLNLWTDRYNTYKHEMTLALNFGEESKNDSANNVIKKYRQMLYEADDFATSSRNIEDIYNEALAIYHASYNKAREVADVKKCGFAWKVAGEALCAFHERKTPGRSIPFKVAVLSMFI